ncbi:MAG TPA: glutathione transferase GstA [Kofleriaceae bacterium]|jgi:glutathione S-transferase
MTFTLYYAPGACSLSPSIAMREAGIAFDLVRVDLRAKKTASGDDFLAINPKGYVPALRLPDGSVLTEGAAMVQYIADQKPESQLAPRAGTMERYRLIEWLNYIATELHKGVSPLYSAAANDEFKKALVERLALRWGVLAAAVRTQPFVLGERFTVADGYACYVLRSWQRSLAQDLSRWPELVDYYARLVARPAIAAALAAEGLEV